MPIAQKIINANTQPNGGCAVVGVSGARALKSDALNSLHTLNPSVLSQTFIDQPIATINAKLNTRYDDPRYYSGDSAS